MNATRGTWDWHAHHECESPLEFLSEGRAERRKQILLTKPVAGHELRFKFFRPFRGKLPGTLDKARADLVKARDAWNKACADLDKASADCVKAYAAWVKARAAWGKASDDCVKASAAWDKASAAWDKAYAAWDKARAAWGKARAACVKAYAAWVKASAAWDNACKENLPAILVLHAKQCLKDCPWTPEHPTIL